MIKQKNKGFTLVELLAVIVVLAIILVIAVPKVMTIIEDAKKGTLESTAKMIASGAEKQKIQNTVLGKEEEITCDSVAKINNADYASCSIEFVNNTAFVTIEGSGKFEGLYVCDGTKTTAEASKNECGVENVTAVKKILSLYQQEETLNNGLANPKVTYEGKEYDTGIRYIGSNPNNYAYYNCDEKDSNNVLYGDENYDYVNSCEVWRILGVFEIENADGKKVKSVKIVNGSSYLTASWDSSYGYDSEYGTDYGINAGYGINQWGESTYENGDFYEGADIMRLLNGYYIGESVSDCNYCIATREEVCTETCTDESLKKKKMKVLTNNAKDMIENVVWDTYAIDEMEDVNEVYLQEKGISKTNNGKICSGTNQDGTTNFSCSDTVIRTTNWEGKVGLMSASDALYAYEWVVRIHTITPFAHGNSSSLLWCHKNFRCHGGYVERILPSVYLKPETYIVCGDGTKELPYVLNMNSKFDVSVCPVYVPPVEGTSTSTSTSTATSEESSNVPGGTTSSTSTATSEEATSTSTATSEEATSTSTATS